MEFFRRQLNGIAAASVPSLLCKRRVIKLAAAASSRRGIFSITSVRKADRNPRFSADSSTLESLPSGQQSSSSKPKGSETTMSLDISAKAKNVNTQRYRPMPGFRTYQPYDHNVSNKKNMQSTVLSSATQATDSTLRG